MRAVVESTIAIIVIIKRGCLWIFIAKIVIQTCHFDLVIQYDVLSIVETVCMEKPVARSSKDFLETLVPDFHVIKNENVHRSVITQRNRSRKHGDWRSRDRYHLCNIHAKAAAGTLYARASFCYSSLPKSLSHSSGSIPEIKNSLSSAERKGKASCMSFPFLYASIPS